MFHSIGPRYKRNPLYTHIRNYGLSYKYVLLNTLKYFRLALAGKVKRIPVDLFTCEYAFSLAPDGWHYFRSLITEYENDPSITLKNTTFYQFFQHKQIRSIRYLNDLLFLHDPEKRSRKDEYKFYFGTFPWGGRNRGYNSVGGRPWGYHYDRVEGKMTRDLHGYRRNPWYQPGDEHPLEREWKITIRLYHSLKKGYYPFKYETFLPSVELLLRRNGEMRAIRYEGHHRLMLLSHFGYENITVLIDPDSLGVIREDEVEEWFYVKHGYCTPDQALEIFNAYFDLTGRERIEYLGLPHDD